MPKTISIDFHSANLSESVAIDNNNKHEQDCFNNLEFIELWKLRRKSFCLDGILDNVLKNKLRPNGYVVDPVEHSTIDADCADLYLGKEELVYYVWCGLHVGSQTELLYYNPPGQTGEDKEMNGLKISAVFSHHVTPDGSAVLSDELCVFTTDNKQPNSGLNGISRVSYDFFMNEVVRDNGLTNLLIHFEPDETNDVLEQQFIIAFESQ